MLQLKAVIRLFLTVSLFLVWAGNSVIACPMMDSSSSQIVVSGDMAAHDDLAMDCCPKSETETDPGCVVMMSCGVQMSQIDARDSETDVFSARSHIKWPVPSVMLLAGLSNAPPGQPPRS